MQRCCQACLRAKTMSAYTLELEYGVSPNQLKDLPHLVKEYNPKVWMDDRAAHQASLLARYGAVSTASTARVECDRVCAEMPAAQDASCGHSSNGSHMPDSVIAFNSGGEAKLCNLAHT
jgi:hypothetical protein